jgi:hypothetical protein
MDLPPPPENLLRDDSCDVDGAARRSSTQASTVVQSTRRSQSAESSATDLPDLPIEASCADKDDGEWVARINFNDSKPPFPFEHTHRSVSAESAMSELPDLPGEHTWGEDDDDSVRRRSSTHKSTLIEFTRRFNFPGGASSSTDSNVTAATLRVYKNDDVNGAVHSQHPSGVDSIV